MKKTIRKDSKLLLPNRGLGSRLRSLFTPLGSMDELIHKGYHPYGSNKNPLVRVFKLTGKGTEQPKEMPKEIEWVLICHTHKFIGLVTPKYYGKDTRTFIICPFCTESAGIMTTCDDKRLTNTLSDMDKPYICRDGIALHITGAWQMLRRKFPTYTNRWTYVNGVPIRVDNEGNGTQFSN